MIDSEFDIQDFDLLGLDPPESGPDSPTALVPAKDIVLDYHPNLPKDVALAPHALNEILAFYKITPEQYTLLENNINYRRDLSRWQQEVAKDGYTLTLRAKGYVEDLLPEMHALFRATDTPAQSKVKIMELLLGVAGVATKAEPDKTTDTPQNPINIQINLG